MEWIAEQVMGLIDFVNTGVLDALGCDMSTFIQLFPVADTMYNIFTAIGLGILLLNFVWQLFKNFGLGIGIEAEDPVKLTMRSMLFIILVLNARNVVEIVLSIAGKPYNWIVSASMPPLEFGNFISFVSATLAIIFNGPVAILALVIVILLAWNYLKLLLEAAERYILLGVLFFTAPVAFGLGGAQATANIFKNWCRMLGGQTFLLIMNAWCLKLFTNMVGVFISDPAQTNIQGFFFVWVLCAIGFLKVSQKIDSFMSSLGISVGHTGGSMLDDAIVAARGLSGVKKMAMAGFGGGKGGGLGGGAPAGGPGGGAPGTFSGGLAGMVGRKINSDTAGNLTASPGSEKGGIFAGIGAKSFNDSIGQEGGFAANVIGSVATGNAARTGMITGDKAADAFSAYMGDTIPSSAQDAAGGEAPVDAAGMDASIPMGEDVYDGGAIDMAGAGELPQEMPDIPMDTGDIAAGIAISEAMDNDQGIPSGVDPYMSQSGSGIPTTGDNGASALESAAASGSIAQETHGTIPSGVDGGTASLTGVEMAGSVETAQSIPTGIGADTPAGSAGTEGAVVTASDSIEASAGIPMGSAQAIPMDTGVRAASGVSTDGFSEAVQNAAFANNYTTGIPRGSEPPTYKNVTMGGGRITGTEVSPIHPKGIQFAMYHTRQYSAPEGDHTVVNSLDGQKWYKQYAQPDVLRTPVSEKNGKVEYREKIVNRLPKAPPRIDRI